MSRILIAEDEVTVLLVSTSRRRQLEALERGIVAYSQALDDEELDLVLGGGAPVDLNVIASAPQAVRDIFDQIKAETMRSLFIPGVNALGIRAGYNHAGNEGQHPERFVDDAGKSIDIGLLLFLRFLDFPLDVPIHIRLGVFDAQVL